MGTQMRKSRREEKSKILLPLPLAAVLWGSGWLPIWLLLQYRVGPTWRFILSATSLVYYVCLPLMLSVDIVFLNVFLAASGCISALKIIDVAIAYSGPVSFAEFVCFSQGYTPSLRLEQDEKRDFRQIRVSGISTMLRGLLKNLAARLLVPFLMDPSLIDDLPITEWLLYHYFSGWFLYLIASQIGDVVFGAMQAASAVPMLDMFNAPYFSTRFDFSPKFIAISIQPARFLVPPMEQAGFPLFPSDYLSVQTSKCWLVKWLFCHAGISTEWGNAWYSFSLFHSLARAKNGSITLLWEPRYLEKT